MHLRLVLEQAWPVLLLQLLLAQNHLDVSRGVVCLGVLNIDLGEEFDLEEVGRLLGV